MDESSRTSASVAGAVPHAVAEAVAEERLRIVAGLIGRTGDWSLAEDCLQDAVERALARWPSEGVPDNPAAWLTTTAHRRAIDVVRRRQNERLKLGEMAAMETDDHGLTRAEPWPDDRLKLIFTCCHPALPMAGRVALTLRTVAGLPTSAVAAAFLTTEATMGQRLLRARARIQHAGIPYRIPDPDQIADRLSGVLAVVYLVFNEGYRDPTGVLATEAVRLVDLLAELLPNDAEVAGLQALLAFQHARRTARFDARGELVPMEEQDRSRYDRVLIDHGLAALRRAAATPPGRYRLQAEIAARHATAPSAESTDWQAIAGFFDRLCQLDPSPVVALNRAVAVAFAEGPAAGLRRLDALEHARELARYHLLPATRADLLRRLGRTDEAASAYRTAIDLAPDGPERRFLRRRLDELQAGDGGARP